MIGWHACATGIDLPTDGSLLAFKGVFRDSVYVGECGPFFPESNHAGPRDNGHRVMRIQLDPATGEATSTSDFLTGLALPTDVRFGPDGAMYVADAEGILRVVEAASSS
jgi:glucose/arabinose dehydrogenase